MWPREDADFTPWLEDHLTLLGDSMGMELESRQREAPVGRYSLDLLAHDLGRDRKVVIENQFNSTDHDHLGKLLTYAAGYDADVVVWLSEEIRDEHRQALDWLNQRTGEDTEFFGVVVELIRVDDSRPAVNFKLLAFPNEWQKKRKLPGTDSERGKAYRNFFQELIDELRTKHNFTRSTKASPQNSHTFKSSKGVEYGAGFNRDDEVWVELWIDQGEVERNKQIFDSLHEEADAIETELAEAVDWQRLDDRRESRIAITRPATIGNDEESLKELRAWIVDQLLRLEKVFGPRLAKIA